MPPRDAMRELTEAIDWLAAQDVETAAEVKREACEGCAQAEYCRVVTWWNYGTPANCGSGRLEVVVAARRGEVR